jgi:Predicted membrane protein (DUF2306)
MLNSRQVTLEQASRFFFRLMFWVPVVFFSLLLVRNTIPYYSFSNTFVFIDERTLLFAKPVYYWSFYFHIGAGILCITASLFQFSSYILKKRRKIHVWSGKIYVFVVLLIGAPTGLYMSFFAKGSFWERALFMFMAIFWFVTTWWGLKTIKEKNVLAHKIWMIRSYSMAMTAVTFRIYHIVFYVLDWNHLKNYEISLWISVLGNMLIAEYFIYKQSKRYLQSFTI